MPTAAELIKSLDLVPLPQEGGYYRESYRSDLVIAREALGATRYDGARCASTAIYYLLTPETTSAMHVLPTDEVFHFYLGDPVEMLQLYPDGHGRRITIGHDLAAGHVLQAVVPAGVWQGARLAAGGAWALMGVTVAPGFEFADYMHGNREALMARYPAFAGEIAALTSG